MKLVWCGLISLLVCFFASTEVDAFQDVYEPPIIVVQPSFLPHAQGDKISLTCVAYGEPDLPNIVWTARSPYGYIDFDSPMVNLDFDISINVSSIVDSDTGLTFVMSVLELCGVDYTFYKTFDDFECLAISPNVTGESTFGQNYSSPFSPRPLIYEPATLLAAPTDAVFVTNGPRVSATCAAYGSPQPIIHWTRNNQTIAENNYTNIYSSIEVDEGGDYIVISILEICNAMFQPIAGVTTCTTMNGVSLESDSRVQSASFDIEPRLRIESYIIQLLGDTAQFNFYFSAPVTLSEDDPCFINKLMFININDTFSPNAVKYTPSYPGTCVPANLSYNITVYLNPRDFPSALNFFLSVDTMFIVSFSNLEQNFVPGFNLYSIRDPMRVSELRRNAEDPRMSSFDVDLTSRRILLHFSDFVRISSFNISAFSLISFSVFPSSPSSVTLNPSSSVVTDGNNFVRTICISISDEDLEAMFNNSVCITSENDCGCYFPDGLVYSFNGFPILGVTRALSLSVFRLVSPAETVPELYLQVSLSYYGCNASYNLERDEVFALKNGSRFFRNGESLISIECIANGKGNNVNPILTFTRMETAPRINSNYFYHDWPRRTLVNFPNGFSSLYYGLYTCETLDNEIQHFFSDDGGRIYFPEGDSYEVQLYESFRVPFVAGGFYPLLDLSQIDINNSFIFNRNNNFGPLFAGQEMKILSDYKGEIFFNLTNFSLEGNYSIFLMFEDGTSITSGVFSVYVSPPDVEVIPPIIAILPSENRVPLRCMTNSPFLPVIWTSSLDNTVILGNGNELTLNVPSQGGFSDGDDFYCVVLDPEMEVGRAIVVGYARAVVRNIPRPLVIFSNGSALENLQQVEVSNAQLRLQCVGHALSNTVSLVWLIEEEGKETLFLRKEMDSGYVTVSFGYNFANLTIGNSSKQFRGRLNCLSTSSSKQVTITVVDAILDQPVRCSGNSTDEMYKVIWEETPEGFADSKPCPNINNQIVEGSAFRRCLEGGEWENFVNVSGCQTMMIRKLREEADEVFSISERLGSDILNGSLYNITFNLRTLTVPKEQSLWAIDLNTTNYLVKNIIERLSRENAQIGLIEVFNNTLDPVNEMGWIELNNIASGGRQLLTNIEEFSIYLAAAQTDAKFDLKRTNIVISSEKFSGSPYSDVVFPKDTDPESNEGQVKIPSSLFEEVIATGIANVFIRNFHNLLPPEDSISDDKKEVVIGSIVLLVQVLTGSGVKTSFGDKLIELNYTTRALLKAGSPRCVSRNETSDKWDDENGVETVKVAELQRGENKTFQVTCTSNHATAFAVLVTIQNKEFDFTIPVYIGCGAVLLSAAVSIFTLLFSCLLDKLRRYSVVPFLTHMSFCSSLICAFVAFWAGIELALVDERACISTAAALHFFFIAAFSWLLCETLVLIFYPLFSSHRFSFIIIFVIGWLLPAIPTVVSLVLLREDYTTSSHCWFFFDGIIENKIVLAFIVPKLAIIAITLVLLLVGCGTTCYRSKNFPKVLSTAYLHLLRFMWCGIFVLLLFLSATWVFALLLVNVYGIDSVITGWVFMAACIALALCLFIFNVVVSVLNQKVDYDHILSSEDATDTVIDPSTNRKAGGYEMMTTHTESTTVIINRPIVENPLATNQDDEQDYDEPPELEESEHEFREEAEDILI